MPLNANSQKISVIDLDCRANIVRKVFTPDGIGGNTESLTTIATVWASITVYRGRESYRAERTESLVSHTVVIREGADVQKGDIITFKDLNMPVKYIDHLTNGRRKYLELFCVDGDPTGA